MRILRKATVIMAVAVSALLSVTGVAKADPPTGIVPGPGDIVGVSTEATQYLCDQLSDDYNTSHPTGPKWYCWDSVNPNTGQTHDPITPRSGAPTIPRPNGSSEGINALTSNTSIDFVMGTRPRNTNDPAYGPGGIAFVVLADDAVTYATTATSNVPPNLTTAQLASIYNCTQTTWPNIKPHLPQTGSDTRAFFLNAIGVTNPGPCVTSGVPENDGTQPALNDPWVLVPYSVSKYLAQADHSPPCGVTPGPGQNKYGCDKHGPMILNSVDGIPPTTGTPPNRTINPAFAATAYGRSLYTVVRYDPTTPDHIPAYLAGIFGSSGWICTDPTAQTDVTNYGFLNDAFCGATS